MNSIHTLATLQLKQMAQEPLMFGSQQVTNLFVMLFGKCGGSQLKRDMGGWAKTTLALGSMLV